MVAKRAGNLADQALPSSETAEESDAAAPNPTASELRNFRLGFSCSHLDWNSTVRRANGIASKRAWGILFPDSPHIP
jgi:hypothetical protein